jgi:uncharacterized OB-fold protein
MEVLRWMGQNWFITAILAGIASETIIRIFNAGKVKAMKCPKCGYRKVEVEVDAED